MPIRKTKPLHLRWRMAGVPNFFPGVSTVLTERVDTFNRGDKSIVLRVMGTFELREGKIAEWRDYFDMAEWTRQATADGGG